MKTSRARNALRKPRIKVLATLLAAAAAVLSIGFGVQGTLAWLNHSDSRDNEVGIMQYIFSSRIQEDFTPPASGTSLVGGETVGKENWVANGGDIPAFVRVRVFPVLTSNPASQDPGKTLHFEAQFGKQLHYVGLNTRDWMDGGDGWFYYRKVLPPRGRTETLFEKVALDKDIVTYSDAVLTVTLIAETVETRKYGSGTKFYYKEAWWGNSVTGGRAAVAAILDPLATG